MASPKSTDQTLDEEGNILPKSGYIRGPPKKEICPPSPIPRLAAAGALDKPIPTAGQAGIERSKEPEIDIPAECYLYDEDRPWVLGKLNKEALDVPEPADPVPLPDQVRDYLDALEKAANAVNTALAEAYKAVGEDGKAPELDTAAMYEQEKIKRGISTQSKGPTGEKVSAPVSSPAPSAPAQAPSKVPQNQPLTDSKSFGQGDAPPAKLDSTSPTSTTGTAKKLTNAK